MSNDVQIQKYKPASFSNGIAREKQTTAIRDLLIGCIEENRMVSMEDILFCWLNTAKIQYLSIYEENRWTLTWDKGKILKYGRRAAETRAKQWFIANLGAAIIKGKILAVPVIDIEPKNLIEPAEPKE